MSAQQPITLYQRYRGYCPRCSKLIEVPASVTAPTYEEWADHSKDYVNADYSHYCLERPEVVPCDGCGELLRTQGQLKERRP